MKSRQPRRRPVNARAILAKLREHDIRVSACGERLLIDAPTGAFTNDLRAALSASKREILAMLVDAANHRVRPVSPIVEYVSSALPSVRFTVSETGDTERDFTLLHRLRHTIEEHQPGGIASCSGWSRWIAGRSCLSGAPSLRAS